MSRAPVTNHSRNDQKPDKTFGMKRRGAVAGRPSPCQVAAIADVPFVVTNQDQCSPHRPRNVGVSRRFAKGGKPSPSVISGGEVPGSDAPLVERSMARTAGSYPDYIASELPQAASSTNGFKLASLFCGCGGVDLGFRSAGFELAFATDYAARACETFAANLGHVPRCADIRELKGSDVGSVDVLTGGFPCVTFSMAGRRAGVVDDLNGKLYLEMCRLINESQPRYFVAENVKGMLSANRGNAVKLVLAAFLRLGYRTSYELVNMAEHGVPQTRQRVVFVGVRIDQWRGQFSFPERTHRLMGDKDARVTLGRAVSLREAIVGLGEPLGEVSDAGDYDKKGKVFRRNTLPAGTITAGEEQAQRLLFSGHVRNDAPVVPTFATSAPRARGDRPSPTAVGHGDNAQPFISGHQSNNAAVSPTYASSAPCAAGNKPSPTAVGHNGGNVHPFIDGVRRMTVRECARVQSFPDWFEFKGSMADCYRQVGNAVPPLYAKRLALALVEYDSRSILS